MMKTFKIYSQLSNMQCHIVNHSHYILHYIPRTYNWKFVYFGPLCSIPATPTSGNHQSDLFL